MGRVATFLKNPTRAQVGLIVLLITNLPVLIITLIQFPTVLEGQNAITLATSNMDVWCTAGSTLLNLIGLAFLYIDARLQGRDFRAIYVISLALFIGAIVIHSRGPIDEGQHFMTTGDITAYHQSMHSFSIGFGLYTLLPSVIAWYFFNPNWRWIPIATGVYRAIINVGAAENSIQNTTLIPLVEGKAFYVLHYNAGALDIYFTIASLIGDLLLCGMWALLLFAPAIVMQPRVDTQETASQTS